MISSETLVDIALSVGLFLAVWYFIGVRVFRPFFRMLEEREARSRGADHTAADRREEIKILQRRLQEAIRNTRLEGIRLRDEMVKVAREDAAEVIHRAQSRATARLERAKEERDRIREAAIRDVIRESELLSRLVYERMLGAPGNDTIH